MSGINDALRYKLYKKAISGKSLPVACLDLDMLDENISGLLERSRSKPVRIATKSIRSVTVLKYIQEKSEAFIGFMSFTLEEACFIADNGLDNRL